MPDWSLNAQAPLRALLDPMARNDGQDPFGSWSGPTYNSDMSIRDQGSYTMNPKLAPFLRLIAGGSNKSDAGTSQPGAEVDWTKAPKGPFQGTIKGQNYGTAAVNSTENLFNQKLLTYDKNYGWVTPSFNIRPEKQGLADFLPMAIMSAAGMGLGGLGMPALMAMLPRLAFGVGTSIDAKQINAGGTSSPAGNNGSALLALLAALAAGRKGP